MTDLWPSEERQIVPGFEIGFCYCNDAVTEGACVKLATGTSGLVKVEDATSQGDATGIALKTGAQYTTVPVAFYGVLKVKLDNGTTMVTTGDFCMNSTTNVSPLGTASATTLKVMTGSSYVLGLALQPAAADGDEFLLLLGKCI